MPSELSCPRCGRPTRQLWGTRDDAYRCDECDSARIQRIGSLAIAALVVLLALSVLARGCPAQSPTFEAKVLPGHDTGHTWSPCCPGALPDHPALAEVAGYTARAGQSWALTLDVGALPACTDATIWLGYLTLGTPAPAPLVYPWPHCSGRTQYASLSTAPLAYAHLYVATSRIAVAAGGASLVWLLDIPPGMEGMEMWFQAGVDRWDLLPGRVLGVAGRVHTWAGRVTVE